MDRRSTLASPNVDGFGALKSEASTEDSRKADFQLPKHSLYEVGGDSLGARPLQWHGARVQEDQTLRSASSPSWTSLVPSHSR